MNACVIPLNGAELTALPSGAAHWQAERVLIVSDLHFGKSERIARRGGALLPPYDTEETLARLAADVQATQPAQVICLGDSFDDLNAARGLDQAARDRITALQAGRRWVWIEGNHDPGPVEFGGDHLGELRLGPLTFRHIAEPGSEPGEISGHYHPKARLKGARRPCFLADATRLILPAYGAYTGGLDWQAPVLQSLFDGPALAYLTGTRVLPVPLPRAA
ncbi:MAG: ligase-associated DNA damage response endonuclease PdeM [Silicimonas sp.]|nr:ligase-associated DNA damage response endonuclease PdeM [Silicimonas sp.]